MKEFKKEVQKLQSLETCWRAFSLDPWRVSLSCEKAFWYVLRKTVPNLRACRALCLLKASTEAWPWRHLSVSPGVVHTYPTPFGKSSIGTHAQEAHDEVTNIKKLLLIPCPSRSFPVLGCLLRPLLLCLEPRPSWPSEKPCLSLRPSLIGHNTELK